MTRKKLQDLLREQVGSDHIQPGYNYTILAVRTRSPMEFLERLRAVRAEVEKQAGIKLLDFVGLTRARSVLVPIPMTALNTVSQAISDHVTGVRFLVPFWEVKGS